MTFEILDTMFADLLLYNSNQNTVMVMCIGNNAVSFFESEELGFTAFPTNQAIEILNKDNIHIIGTL